MDGSVPVDSTSLAMAGDTSYPRITFVSFREHMHGARIARCVDDADNVHVAPGENFLTIPF